jgi:hypothetical protein
MKGPFPFFFVSTSNHGRFFEKWKGGCCLTADRKTHTVSFHVMHWKAYRLPSWHFPTFSINLIRLFLNVAFRINPIGSRILDRKRSAVDVNYSLPIKIKKKNVRIMFNTWKPILLPKFQWGLFSFFYSSIVRFIDNQHKRGISPPLVSTVQCSHFFFFFSVILLMRRKEKRLL